MMRIAAAVAAALLLAAPALAQTGPKDSNSKDSGSKDRAAGFGALGSNKEPIKIDADRLDVFDRDSRAVFAGNVVAVQGDSTMRCAILTVHYEQRKDADGKPAASPAAQGGAPADSAIKKIDCKGPVTIVSKTQVATGDNATFDRVGNKVLLSGNVTLSDGPNVTRGDKIVYDLNTGVANIETAPGGRVKALFVPGSNPEGKPDGRAKPATN